MAHNRPQTIIIDAPACDVRKVPTTEVDPVYSITLSARPSSGSGTVRPSDLAVLRSMYKLTLVDCWTGIVAGFSPLRIKTFV
jgi:hypothetical protein